MNFQQYITPTSLAICGGFVVVLAIIKKHFSGGVYQQKVGNLAGKFAVITGGNSGIGAETVKYLTSLDCNVVIGGRDKNTA